MLLLLLSSDVVIYRPSKKFDGRVVLVGFQYMQNGVVYDEWLSNCGFTAKATDTAMPNHHFKGLLIGDPFMSCGFDEPLGIGNLKLKNTGELDKFMTDCAAEGRDIYIYTGNQSQDCSEFTQIFKGIIKSLHFSNDELNIIIADNKELLNRDVQEEFYPETASNTYGIDGKPKPLLFGICYNISPLLIAEDTYEFCAYQVFDQAFTTYDSGVQLSSSLATPAMDGSGNFSLSQKPYGVLTANFSGVYSTSLDIPATGQLSPASVFRTIVSYVFGSNQTFDEDAFTRFFNNTAPHFQCGIYLTEKTNAVQLLDDLLKQVNATWFYNENGDIEIAEFDITKATNTYAKVIINSYQILSIGIETDDNYSVAYNVVVNTEKNWTIQEKNTLAATLTDAEKNTRGKAFLKSKTANDGTIKTNYPTAITKTVDNEYIWFSDATHAANLLTLYSKPRFLMKVKCTGYNLVSPRIKPIRLGDTIKVISERYGERIGILKKKTHYFVSDTYDLEILF